MLRIHISRCVAVMIMLQVVLLLSACSGGPPPALQFLAPLAEVPADTAAVTPTSIPLQQIATATPTATSHPTSTPFPTLAATTIPTPTLIPPPNPLTERLDSFVTRLADSQRFQGSVLVAHRGTILLSKGYGWASKEGQVLNTPQTRFRLASVSKQFTAFAIMQLQAQGKLSVQDPVCTYLTDCPAHWRNITIHHLLTHTSGLPNYTEFPSFGAKRMISTTPDELVGRFRHLRLLSKPGAVFKYQNSDYVLLGMIIERISGQSYADFLRTSIFKPLDLSASGVAPSIGDAHIDAVGYRFWDRPARLLEPSTLYGCGSLASTVEDLYRWEQALFTNELLPPSELEQMFTPHQHRYGYGLFIERIGGRLRIGHPGKIDGFASSVANYPEEQVTVIVLSNLWTADTEGISARLADLVFQHQ